MRSGEACRRHEGGRRWGRLWQPNAAVGSTLVAVVVPKCPLCLMGIGGAVGLGSLIDPTWTRAATLALLGLAVGMLVLVARRRRAYRPVLLGAAAAALVFLGKFQGGGGWLAYSGVALLVAASLWSARAGRSGGPAGSSECGC